MRKIIKCLWYAIVRTIQQDGVEHAGYMAFVMLLSIFPFLIFFIALTSFFGASELGHNLIQFLLDNIPSTTTQIIRTRLNEINSIPPQSLLNLAIIGSVWTASSFVECLRTILNRVYDIKSPPAYIIRRLLSIVQFLIISAVLIFTIFLLVLTPIILSKVPVVVKAIESYAVFLNTMRYFFIVFVLFISTVILYYIIPNVQLKLIQVIPGAILTVSLWLIGGRLLSKNIVYYNQLSFVYGSIGSIIITLIFFYLINMIFIYGAEFNYLLFKEFNNQNNTDHKIT